MAADAASAAAACMGIAPDSCAAAAKSGLMGVVVVLEPVNVRKAIAKEVCQLHGPVICRAAAHRERLRL